MFFETASEVKRLVYSFKNPLLVHHYDADGICGAAVVSKALLDKNIPFRRIWVKNLNDDFFDLYSKEKELIFVDLGNGCDRIKELNDFVVLDHHQPTHKNQFNPVLFGYDGGSEISAAGVCSLVFEQQYSLGVVGAVGDVQQMVGLNEQILKRALSSKEIAIERYPAFYGLFSRTLYSYLLYADPPIPAVSTNALFVQHFLDSLGLDGEMKFLELSKEEQKAFLSKLIEAFANHGKIIPFSDHYILLNRPLNETREAKSFATLLNACGRHGKADLGVNLCLGRDYDKIDEVLQYHRRKVREAIAFARIHKLDLGEFVLIDGRGYIKEEIIGIICGMLNELKPVVGLASSGSNVKISMRASTVDVAEILPPIAQELGGTGGGHENAGGATIPKDSVEDFLERIKIKLKQE